jgi:hypothetical protein
MANGHGGYRQPSEPAPVSGPGALSQRTDGQGARYMAGGEYGEGQEMMNLQTSAPMAKTETLPRSRGGRQAAMPEGVMPTPLFAPSERPNEPLTAGAPFGPGPGSVAPMRRTPLASRLAAIADRDDSGEIDEMLSIAERFGL